MKRLITGGAGFIGSHAVRHFLGKDPDGLVVTVDNLSYAANPENLADVREMPGYRFEEGDVRDRSFLRGVFSKYGIDQVIHLAAESHVDRSIMDATPFVRSNVEGTVTLMDVAREHWEEDDQDKCFLHVSTDEVYGALGAEGYFTRDSPYDPRSPYAASKAASDHFARAYFNTYGFPVIITNCSNNYGPCQYPEKLIPLMINNILNEASLPIYGQGNQVRDWIWVEDHVAALDRILEKGKAGGTYLIGARNEWRNIDLVKRLCAIMDEKLDREKGASEQLITFVRDREGHDPRYAIDPTDTERELGWEAKVPFNEGLERTVDWYLAHKDWLANTTSGSYRAYYKKQYRRKEG